MTDIATSPLTTEKMTQILYDKDQVAQLMARHVWFHARADHIAELDTIWVTEHPDPHFAQNQGYYVQSLRSYYGELGLAMRQTQLEQLASFYPDVEITPENYYAGLLQVHALTTPFIEIAGDGQTAKGVWYTPGIVAGVAMDGSGESNGFWCWERYGVDFAKENGEWKIWHLHTYTDLLIPVGEKWSAVSGSSLSGMGVSGQDGEELPPPAFEMPRPDREEITYHEYSYKQVPQNLPRLPEPYWTFSETFSY
jgi:hypothetical protein